MISILELVASSRGGGAVHVRDLTRVLDPNRLTVTVAMAEDGGNVTATDFTDQNVPFHRLDIASGPALRALLKLRGLLKDERFDILHCHGGRGAFHGRVAAALLRGGRPRVVYSIHGFTAPRYGFVKSRILLGLERLLVPFTDAFIAVSEAERKDFLAAGFASPERVHLVRYGIDTGRFADVVIDEGEQRTALGVPVSSALVTTVSRLYFPKDPYTLLNAFAVVRAQCSHAHLLIVGDGPYRPQVESLITDLGLTAHVTLAGFRRDIPQILAATDVFVLSTTSGEGLPITILEAMSSGLPVVASDVTGVNEEVMHEETGLILPPKNPVALSEALLALLSDEQRASAMGSQGRSRAERLFALDRMARETMEIYEAVINQV